MEGRCGAGAQSCGFGPIRRYELIFINILSYLRSGNEAKPCNVSKNLIESGERSDLTLLTA